MSASKTAPSSANFLGASLPLTKQNKRLGRSLLRAAALSKHCPSQINGSNNLEASHSERRSSSKNKRPVYYYIVGGAQMEITSRKFAVSSQSGCNFIYYKFPASKWCLISPSTHSCSRVVMGCDDLGGPMPKRQEKQLYPFENQFSPEVTIYSNMEAGNLWGALKM